MRGGLCDFVEIVAIDADGAYRPRRAINVYQLRAVENVPGGDGQLKVYQPD
jgi:hypothetical protein